MQRFRIQAIAILVVIAALMISVTGCFSSNGSGGNSTSEKVLPVKPNPKVESVIATTSGTQTAYYAILDIKVKNEGAEGTILVVASISQNGKTSQNEMDVYLKQGRTHEMKLTFPLAWKGGEWTSDVKVQVP